MYLPRSGGLLIGLIAFAVYALVAAAVLAQLWFHHVFFRDLPEQTQGTAYLSKFYLVSFVLGCIAVGGSVLAMLGSARRLRK